MSGNAPGYYTRAMEDLRETWGGRCVVDGSTDELQFAHLKRTRLSGTNGRGLPQRVQDIRRHPDRYVLLCHGCHVKLDNNQMLGD